MTIHYTDGCCCTYTDLVVTTIRIRIFGWKQKSYSNPCPFLFDRFGRPGIKCLSVMCSWFLIFPFFPQFWLVLSFLTKSAHFTDNNTNSVHDQQYAPVTPDGHSPNAPTTNDHNQYIYVYIYVLIYIGYNNNIALHHHEEIYTGANVIKIPRDYCFLRCAQTRARTNSRGK